VNKLISDGTYEKILKKWGTTGSAIAKSQISPPELKN
jgi:polar amino acid transport system substrate-binding protein